MKSTNACIFHITRRSIAEAARQSGEYRADSLDSDGFIHLSQAHQVLEVARLFYAGLPDLVVLVVDPNRLRALLRWEPPASPAHGQQPATGTDHASLYPHLYGPLNADAIIDLIDLERFDGKPVHTDAVAAVDHDRVKSR